jgi:hypothetical protein
VSPDRSADATAKPARVGEPASGLPADGLPPIVDWRRTARRLRTLLVGIGVVVVTAWVVIGVSGDGLEARLLGELVGLGLLVAFVAEVVVVGGSAIRGLLAAGARGHRLSHPDVSLLPPQVVRAVRGAAREEGVRRDGPSSSSR